MSDTFKFVPNRIYFKAFYHGYKNDEKTDYMRILLVIQRFDFGGAENHVCDLANSLVDRGHQVWLCGGRGRQLHRLHPAVRHQAMLFRDMTFIFQTFQIARLIRFNQIQLVHAHQRLPIQIGCLAGKLTDVPTVATVHGKTFNDLRKKFTRKNLARVIFVSNHILTKAARFPELREKSVYIPNGVPLVSSNSRHSKHKLVYISRINGRHSSILLTLIEKILPTLIDKYPFLSLEIVGDGKRKEEIRDAVRKVNAKSHREVITFSGYQTELNRILSQAALVLGVGRVIIEAMAHDVPALSVNAEHLGPVVTQSNYELMRHTNFVAVDSPAPTPERLLQTIMAFLDNSARWQLEMQGLQARVLEDFNLSRITGQIENIYHSVLTNPLRNKAVYRLAGVAISKVFELTNFY